MRVLLDSNVLLRLEDSSDPRHAKATEQIRERILTDDMLFIVPQNLYEFWTAATRSQKANGLGMTPDAARDSIRRYLAEFVLLDDTPAVWRSFLELVTKYGVTGTNAYDTRLVAAMQAHNVDAIVTFNASDLRRYSEIVVIDADQS